MFRRGLHIMPKPDACEHDFDGWCDNINEKGQVTGGEKVCKKCGMREKAHSLACARSFAGAWAVNTVFAIIVLFIATWLGLPTWLSVLGAVG